MSGKVLAYMVLGLDKGISNNRGGIVNEGDKLEVPMEEWFPDVRLTEERWKKADIRRNDCWNSSRAIEYSSVIMYLALKQVRNCSGFLYRRMQHATGNWIIFPTVGTCPWIGTD